jgi:phosphatidate cytidylyltransferase
MSRVLSAAVLIAIIAVTIWMFPPWATTALAAVAAAVAGSELASLATPASERHDIQARLGRFLAGLGAAIVCASMTGPVDRASNTDIPIAILLLVMINLALVALASARPSADTLTKVPTNLMALIYVGLPLGTLAWIRVYLGPAALTWLIAVIALSDSAQYYTGRAFGRRKLAPLVSPGKTVEGGVGGLVIAAVAGGALARWAMPNLSLGVAVALALIIALFGMAGDLFESLLKRSARVKDSSGLIPGHGGVLDRIDAYLFAAPVFYAYVRLIA